MKSKSNHWIMDGWMFVVEIWHNVGKDQGILMLLRPLYMLSLPIILSCCIFNIISICNDYYFKRWPCSSKLLWDFYCISFWVNSLSPRRSVQSKTNASRGKDKEYKTYNSSDDVNLCQCNPTEPYLWINPIYNSNRVALCKRIQDSASCRRGTKLINMLPRSSNDILHY